MKAIEERINAVDGPAVAEAMNAKGYALIPGVLHEDECNQLIRNYDTADWYRKTITMERYRFGPGEYKYFSYPLPPLVQALREGLYAPLALIANGWMQALNMPSTFPQRYEEYQARCHAAGHQAHAAHPAIRAWRAQYAASGLVR